MLLSEFVPNKDVCQSTRTSVVVICISTNNDSVTRNSNTHTKVIVVSSIVSYKLGLMRPRDSVSNKDVSHSTINSVVAISPCTNDDGVAMNFETLTKRIVGSTIKSYNFGLMRPSGSISNKDVSQSTRTSVLSSQTAPCVPLFIDGKVLYEYRYLLPPTAHLCMKRKIRQTRKTKCV